MKHSSKNSLNSLLLKLDDDIIKYCDKAKLTGYTEEIPLGIRNNTLFQKFCNFHWPAWLNNISNVKDPSFHHTSPYLLLNNNFRDNIVFPNSAHYIRIDLTGMISPVDDFWSVEFWILAKDKLFRPQENYSSVVQTRNLESFLIETKWDEKNFKFSESFYNLDSPENNLHEVVANLSLYLRKDNIPHRLFVVIRPYNLESIGNVNSIEYDKKSGIVNINNKDRMYLEKKPDHLYAGNSSIGDITFTGNSENINNTVCKFGMAAMAFGYDVRKGSNDIKIRLNIGKAGSYKPVKTDHHKEQSKYIENCRLKYRKGINLSFPDNRFQDWFNGSRISSLNHLDMELSSIAGKDKPLLKAAFFISSGYNRMGLFTESKKIIESSADSITKKSKPEFPDIINICYYIHTFSDYFKLSRDIDYLQGQFRHIREAANIIFQYSSGIKKHKGKPGINSISYYLIKEHHLFDLIIIASALSEYSYMARCLGIFNEELKYSKEYQRLERIFLNEINQSLNNQVKEDSDDIGDPGNEAAGDIEIPLQRNEHFAYNILAGFPFSLNNLAPEKLKEIADEISHCFTDNPLYFKTIGATDILFSVLFGINCLKLKNSRAYIIIDKLLESGKKRFVLPEYANPNTGHGIMGCGDSGTAVSAFFILLRSVVFMDSQDRLEIFPFPKKEWFSEGSEITVQNAPSIFGNLNFKCVSTRNEIQLHFYDVPRFIPPEIMINFPFQIRIKQEDDFIIKKETANSYLIHGWPVLVRFKRK
ncbi:MAG: hypothetical protein JW864_18615 [Spirochaetes bacterium]|nr:hypothetical protein [Spirochaetota bacterium]